MTDGREELKRCRCLEGKRGHPAWTGWGRGGVGVDGAVYFELLEDAEPATRMRQRLGIPANWVSFEGSFGPTMLLSWRLGMNIAASSDLRIRQARVTKDEISVSLMDGRVVSVPLAWSWRLCEASAAQRANFRLIGTGQGIHWPDIDEDLSVEGMLYGSPARRPQPSGAGRGAPEIEQENASEPLIVNARPAQHSHHHRYASPLYVGRRARQPGYSASFSAASISCWPACRYCAMICRAASASDSNTCKRM